MTKLILLLLISGSAFAQNTASINSPAADPSKTIAGKDTQNKSGKRFFSVIIFKRMDFEQPTAGAQIKLINNQIVLEGLSARENDSNGMLIQGGWSYKNMEISDAASVSPIVFKRESDGRYSLDLNGASIGHIPAESVSTDSDKISMVSGKFADFQGGETIIGTDRLKSFVKNYSGLNLDLVSNGVASMPSFRCSSDWARGDVREVKCNFSARFLMKEAS
ncbi:MAG: hypothetical protein KGN37_16300 [Burkholderiales bacterium]|nr:hypothetical protein [Burkholderiales bacterium]